MPLASYSDLQAEVAAWLRRGDLAGEIPSFIALAEAQMNRRLRVRPMVCRLTQSQAAEYFDLPSDFLAERELKVITADETSHALAYLPPEALDVRSRGGPAGRPRFYSVYGGCIRLLPAPDVAYQTELLYWQAIPALSDANPSNWLLQAHPDAYLYGALTQSAPYLRADERLQTWGTLFTTVLTDIETADRTGWTARLRGETPRRRGTFDIHDG